MKLERGLATSVPMSHPVQGKSGHDEKSNRVGPLLTGSGNVVEQPACNTAETTCRKTTVFADPALIDRIVKEGIDGLVNYVEAHKGKTDVVDGGENNKECLREQWFNEVNAMIAPFHPNHKLMKSGCDHYIVEYLAHVKRELDSGGRILNFKEFVAIGIYSFFGYTRVNTALRLNSYDKYKEYVEILQGALRELSGNAIGKTFRGNCSAKSDFAEGDKCYRDDFTSTSADIFYGLSFGIPEDVNSEQRQKLLIMFGRTSASISEYSKYPGEKEHLYPDHTQWLSHFSFDLDSYNDLLNCSDGSKSQSFMTDFRQRGKEIIAAAELAKRKELHEQGCDAEAIDKEVFLLTNALEFQWFKRGKLLQSGGAFVVMEQDGLPASAGSQGYVDALDLAALPHARGAATGIPSAQLDFMPGVGVLEDRSTSGIPLDYRFTLRDEYSKESGTDEIRQHTEAVIAHFDRHFAPTFERTTGFPVSFMVQLLALHAIGRGPGSTLSQHATGKEIIKSKRDAIALSREDSNIIADIIVHDPLAGYFQGLVSEQECAALLNAGYEKVIKYKPEITRKQYFALMSIYYRCDAGANPQSAQKMLDGSDFNVEYRAKETIIRQPFLEMTDRTPANPTLVTRFYSDLALLEHDVHAWLEKYKASFGANPVYQVLDGALPASLQRILAQAGLTAGHGAPDDNSVGVFSSGKVSLPELRGMPGLKRKHFVLSESLRQG